MTEFVATADLELTAEQVADFLHKQPQFFVQHSQLLCDLQIPHHTGASRSLIEYQVSQLRQRCQQLSAELEQVHQAAHHNEQLFRLCTELTTELLDCHDLASVIGLLQTYCSQNFQMDAVSLKLFKSPQDPALSVYQLESVSALDLLGDQISLSGILCGPLRPPALQFLFGTDQQDLGSVALIALGPQASYGLLALGSQDPHKFDAQMGTLFLRYIGDIVGRLLPRWLQAA